MPLRSLCTLAAVTMLLTTPLAEGEAPVEETRMTLREELLRIINRDRVANGLDALALDPLASSVADAYCREQIRNGTTGHFTVDGLTPYMRYSFAGGNDSVTENAAAWSGPFQFDDRALLDMVRRSQKAMLREIPPDDGHRRAILDPHATHVGIGLAWEGGEFRLAQEFIRRYVQWTQPFPRALFDHEKAYGAARPVAGYSVEAITVYHEAAPVRLTKARVNAMRSYSLPERRRDYLPKLPSQRARHADGTLYEIRREYADGRRGDFTVAEDGSFSFTVPFVDGPGVYTVVVWVQRDGDDDAAPIPTSNISIRVDRSRALSSAGRGAGTR